MNHIKCTCNKEIVCTYTFICSYISTAEPIEIKFTFGGNHMLVTGFPPRRPGFKPGSSHVGFVVEESGAGAGFLRVFRFPLPIFIPPISAQSPSPIIWGWYNRPVVAAVPTVPPHILKKNKKSNIQSITIICD
jgi:hypothetical protein